VLFYTDEMLYLGFRCKVDRANTIRAHVAPREDINADDQIGIYLDTYNDDLQAFVFYINALGIQQDARLTESGGWNQNWDTVLYSRGQVSADSFVVEVGIPFRSLRFPAKQDQTWGLILTRKFAAQGVKAIWPKVTRNASNFIGQAASLEGLAGISSGRHLEVQPTLVTHWGDSLDTAENQLGSAAQIALGDHAAIAPGLSVKYGITSNLTLDVAINPDFSQIESDPSALDLNTRFPLSFSERRPFFLEGAETLRGAPYLLLNTRTIRSPLWGLKLTGKTGRTSIGLLTAYDTAPFPSFTHSSAPETPGFDPEDLVNEDGTSRGALISVARVAQDVGTRSVVGLTLVDKEVVDPASGETFGFHRYAAADAQLQFGQHDRLTGSLEYNMTGERDGEAIDAAGYFLSYQHTQRKFFAQLDHGYEPPDFRALASFLPLVGVVFTDAHGNVLLEPKIPGVVYLRPQLNASVFYSPEEGRWTDLEVTPSLYTRFAGQNYLALGWSNHHEVYQVPSGIEAQVEAQVEAEGEAEFIDFEQQRFEVGLESAMFNALSWNIGLEEGDRLDYRMLYDDVTLRENPAAIQGHAFAPYVGLTLRPTTWLLATGSYQREWFLDASQSSISYLIDGLTGAGTVRPRYDQTVFNGLLSLNFTPAWSVRVLGRLEQSDDTLSGLQGDMRWNVLLTWLPHPGTAAYLGAGQSLPWNNLGTGDDAWQVFFKLSYLWRV